MRNPTSDGESYRRVRMEECKGRSVKVAGESSRADNNPTNGGWRRGMQMKRNQLVCRSSSLHCEHEEFNREMRGLGPSGDAKLGAAAWIDRVSAERKDSEVIKFTFVMIRQ